jgi:hypothetical protein
MRAFLITVAFVVVGALFGVGCGQTSSPTSAPLAPSSLASAATGVTAQSIGPTEKPAAHFSAGWSIGWDVFSEQLDDNSKVDWLQPPGQPSNLHITYHLNGARPNWGYQVGVHLFDRCDPAFGQYPKIIPCSTPATRQNVTRNVQAFDFGAVNTDATGNGAQTFIVQGIEKGDYELEFDVRASVGCPFSGSCDVIFQSPGPIFGVGTVTISIP